MIDRFWGAYRFLSNFWPATVLLDDVEYPSVEHAYQAAKTTDPAQRETVRRCLRPGDAKKVGGCVDLRPDWNAVRLSIMEDLVQQKFTRDPNLGRLLRLTGHEELVEGNTWGDRFWGTCQGEGENHLGKILMKIRAELRPLEDS